MSAPDPLFPSTFTALVRTLEAKLNHRLRACAAPGGCNWRPFALRPSASGWQACVPDDEDLHRLVGVEFLAAYSGELEAATAMAAPRMEAHLPAALAETLDLGFMPSIRRPPQEPTAEVLALLAKLDRHALPKAKVEPEPRWQAPAPAVGELGWSVVYLPREAEIVIGGGGGWVPTAAELRLYATAGRLRPELVGTEVREVEAQVAGFYGTYRVVGGDADRAQDWALFSGLIGALAQRGRLPQPADLAGPTRACLERLWAAAGLDAPGG